jgi:hypothetical protein
VENITASDHATTAPVELARSEFRRRVIVVRYRRTFCAAIGQRRNRAVRPMLLRTVLQPSRNGPDRSNALTSAVAPSIAATIPAKWLVIHKMQKHLIVPDLRISSPAVPVARLLWVTCPMPLGQPAKTRYRTAIGPAARYLRAATSVSSFVIKANVCPA